MIDPNRHDRPPLRDQAVPEELLRAKLDAMVGSDYAASLRTLKDLVAGKTILGSTAGHSGFMVELNDGGFLVAYLDEDRLKWRHSTGRPSSSDFSLMASPVYVDASQPLTQDRPYAGESCDIAAEVMKAHGQVIHSIAVGEDTFNLTFPDGHELDTMIVQTPNGKRGLRVFWEQW